MDEYDEQYEAVSLAEFLAMLAAEADWEMTPATYEPSLGERFPYPAVHTRPKIAYGPYMTSPWPWK